MPLGQLSTYRMDHESIQCVGNCNYSELGANVRAVKDQMIHYVLIIGTHSEKARDKRTREGTRVTWDQVITILQTEDSTSRTLSAFSSATKSMHYVKYDHKKAAKEEKDQVKRRLHLLPQGHPKLHTTVCQNFVSVAKRSMHRDMRRSAEHSKPSTTTAVS